MRPGRKSAVYWRELELYWQGYLEAYERFVAAPEGSVAERLARADMRRELALRRAVENGPRDR